MKIFFTSDTFFGRSLASAQRGFNTVDEMNDVLIDNWNSRVEDDDIVYHLGNFAWDPISAEAAIIHLKGKINFVGGSYDKHMSEISLIKTKRHFLLPSISFIPTHDIVISHWPLLDWPERESGTMHLHGGPEAKTEISDWGTRFNVSCDKWGLSPIDLDTLKDIVEATKENKKQKA